METPEVATIRFEQGTLQQLRRLAHIRSLERNVEVSWASIVREAVEAMLRSNESSNEGEG